MALLVDRGLVQVQFVHRFGPSYLKLVAYPYRCEEKFLPLLHVDKLLLVSFPRIGNDVHLHLPMCCGDITMLAFIAVSLEWISRWMRACPLVMPGLKQYASIPV